MYPQRWIVPAALLGLWGLWGLVDLGKTPSGGFDWGHSEVIAVEPGGPADQAGLKKGDRILTMGGIPVTDLTALRRRPRTEIGETDVLVVERTDAATGARTTEDIRITYSGLPLRARTTDVVAGLIGFAFLLSGLTVFLKTQSTPALLFALLGFGFSAALLPHPYIGAYGLRIATMSVFFMAFLTGFACLLHFLMIFPKRKRVAEKKHLLWLIYAPVAAFALVGLVITVLGVPPGTLQTPAAVLLGIILVGYVLLSLGALIHSFVTTERGERNAEGLNIMLAGVVIGLLPLTATVVAGMAGVRIDLLPGGDWIFVTLILIPISFAVALLKSARAPQTPVAG